ncbi:hypothetical protein, variant [Aphanomyces invadans]|uniref:C3H1-type domain-containing protein n=1 Tax=Aphanomyces invadans TaxID=157072 RepID=A0A024THS4_9STRA|nr:hypothetical protein, variant [Aphanomyces invadans]ETV93141.1 hypothetical protein, variant [Aphanomyces invadans]|eukprot:XP_008878162.1 hypothetical protein, variant [Aphanomyces invadans]
MAFPQHSTAGQIMRVQVVVELLPQRSTVCLSFDQCDVTAEHVKTQLNIQMCVPMSLVQLLHGTTLLGNSCEVPHAPNVLRAVCGRGLSGGKGGFGAMLRSQGKGAGAKATRDFGSCRDLSGRRLRHVNQEIAIKKWNDEEGLRAQRKKDGVEDRELPMEETPSGIAGWHLSTPTWAEGFGKKASSRMKRKRKTVMCTSWIQARARATPPPGARRDWGCPRGRNCNYAHGEEELRGEELTLYKQQQKEKAQRETDQAREHYVHAMAPADIEADVNDAFLAGLRQRKALQASQDAIKLELQTKMVYTPGDTKWGTSTLASRAGAWLVPLNGNVHVEQSTPELNATVEGRGTFGTATVFGCALHQGKWYYEVELVTSGVIQLGWADATFEADDDEGDGVGDHIASWAYDGCRQVKWTNGESVEFGDMWSAGDVIGCAVDIGAGEISFSRNGVPLGVAFVGIEASEASSVQTGGLFPAFSLEEHERIRVNIGDHKLLHIPDSYLPVLNALVGETAPPSCERVCHAIPAPMVAVASPQKFVLPADAGMSLPSPTKDTVQQNDKCPHVADEVEGVLEDLMSFESIDDLKALGMDKLKDQLKRRGLKCGYGT